MIVITTPTGQIGRQVLGNLLDSGEQLRVIARDPSKLPAGVRKDLDIVEGSHGDAAVVDKAFAGAGAVLWLTPADRRAPSVQAAFAGFTGPAAEAFTRHGVGRVVGVSTLGRGTPWAAQAGFATGSLAMDDLIAASGVAYRALAYPYFMENTLLQADWSQRHSPGPWPRYWTHEAGSWPGRWGWVQLFFRDLLSWEDASWPAMTAGHLVLFRVGARRCPMASLTGELQRREAPAHREVDELRGELARLE